jgi:prephenate dehydrogenase
MKIAVIGLGLIGGSFCKTIKKHTLHTVLGYDLNSDVVEQACKSGAIDAPILPQDFYTADFTIISLHPVQTIEFCRQYAKQFTAGSIVIDTCGVKESIVSVAEPLFSEYGVHFVGCHPMAGREFSGFDYSLDNLFDQASFIITPTEQTDPSVCQQVKSFAEELGFPKVVFASTQEHDRIIAFTSQLAHVVSNAYVKSPSLQNESGFSAGSFLDLTRVAKLNENMWTDLFLMNREALLFELDTIIHHLTEYRDAIDQQNHNTLKQLLRDGRILKEQSIKEHQKSDQSSKG